MKRIIDKKQPDVFYRYIHNGISGEFHIIAVGRENCAADKELQGPVVKNRFITHFCTAGKGYYTIDGRTYTITKGDIFYIPANHKISYYPDRKNPWSYFWFEYNGQNSTHVNERAGFTPAEPVYKTAMIKELSEMLSGMLDNLKTSIEDLAAVSYVYNFFTVIIQERAQKEPGGKRLADATDKDETIKNILAYTNDNYYDPSLSIVGIGNMFNFNVSYLSRKFKEAVGLPFSKYLTDYRMQKAGELLEREDLSIKSIALSVGYRDPLYFSREFRRFYRVSPTNYRRERLTDKKKEQP